MIFFSRCLPYVYDNSHVYKIAFFEGYCKSVGKYGANGRRRTLIQPTDLNSYGPSIAFNPASFMTSTGSSYIGIIILSKINGIETV